MPANAERALEIMSDVCIPKRDMRYYMWEWEVTIGLYGEQVRSRFRLSTETGATAIWR